MERQKLYAQIPDELLGAFYNYIKKNIDQGTRVELMNDEIDLIKKESDKRGISLAQLKELGAGFINNEIDLLNKSM